MKNISVCVPADNSGSALATTLRSILEQDTDVEVILLDNASTDDTAALAYSFDDPRVHLHRNAEALPLGEHWNKAVSLSTGRFVKVVRAGDSLLPGALDKQLEVMGDNSIALCSAKYQIVDAAGRVRQTDRGLPHLLGRRDARAVLRALVPRGPADFGPTATTVFRRQDFDRVGGFRGDPGYPMDVDLIARLCLLGAFYGMPETLAARPDSGSDPIDDTSPVTKLTEMLRLHHRLAAEYPQYVGRGAVLGGDLRLVRAAARRVRPRTLASALRRPELPH
ncbi:glycosyltransferase family 2 protein [Nocardia sp. NPDC059240]|uniref:glycosyltransferase family 2 protein n=1 Tax=Nocardia sp. NPDC059240 TaxID=3346786 RepID=UPI0036BB998E